MGGGLVLVLLATRFVGVPRGQPVSSARGQAQGPLIHPTPPLVPTGCRTHLPPFGCQTSSGRERICLVIPRFGWQRSLGCELRRPIRRRVGAGLVPALVIVA